MTAGSAPHGRGSVKSVDPTPIRAGAADADITPDREVMLAGSFHVRRAREVACPLAASVLVLDDGAARLVFVSCDLLLLPDGTAADLRRRVAGAAGTSPERVAVSCTHTHNAHSPVRTLPELPVDEELGRRTLERVAAAAADAAGRLAPARLRHARTTAPCSFNRRIVLADGRVWMSPGPQDPPVVGTEGPADQDLQVLAAESPSGAPLALLVNYGAHATLLYSVPKISADFPGEMRRALRERLGPVPVLYLQGACGNTSPIDFLSPAGPAADREAMAGAVGRTLADAVLAALPAARPVPRVEPMLAAASSSAALPARRRGPGDPTLEEARRYCAEHPADRIDPADEGAMLARYFHAGVAALEGAEPFRETWPAEIAAYRAGDVAIAANPAELFAEYQLEIKSRSPFPATMVAELTNGWCGYVPTARALAGGSYEARLAPSSKLSADAGRIIVRETLAALGRIASTDVREGGS